MANTHTPIKRGNTMADRWVYRSQWVFDSDCDGTPVKAGGFTDKAVQITGTPDFGGGTLTMQGSMDGTDWFTLRDLDAADMAWTADPAYSMGIRDLSLYIRPVLSGATAPDITLELVAASPAAR